MNFKTTYVLFGLLGAMLAVLGIVLYYGPSAPPGRGNVFPSMSSKANPLEARQVDKIVIEVKKPAEQTLTFERAGEDAWKITTPHATPADGRQVSNLLDQLKSAPLDETAEVPGSRTAGLDEPSRVVTVHAGDRKWTLTVGEVTPGEESADAYVFSSDYPGKPLAVRKRQIEAALEGLNYFRAKELLGDNTGDARSVKLSGKKGAVELKKDGERWKMVRPNYGDVDIGQLLTQLGDLRVDYKDDKQSDFVKDQVTALGEYGLDPAKPETMRVEITRGEGDKAVTQAALVGKKVGDKYYAAFDAPGPARDVVKVPASAVEPIQKWLDDPGAFRSKALLALESFKQPDAIDVDNSYGTLSFRRPDPAKPWVLYRGETGTNVDEGEARKLVDALNNRTAVVSFVDEKRRKELGLEKPDVTVRVWAEALEKADAKKPAKPAFKKDARPATVLHFCRQEGGNVAVERVWGDDKALVMVPASVLDQVRKGPLSYFDRTIPRFNPGSAEENVSRVELRRDGQDFVVTRKGDSWVFEKPARFKGRRANDDAVRDVLGELNRLTAREVVAEKADAKTLDGYGLKSPPVRAVVTYKKDGKPATEAFDFGKEAAGKGVYFKLGGKDMVYLLGAEALAPLRKELRDTTVFSFKPDQVVSLSVQGPKLLPGLNQPLVFEHKGGTWTPTLKGYSADTEKVVSLVEALSRLRLEKFVDAGKGLNPADKPLVIEVTLSDKSVLKLTVGAEADKSSYFATSSTLQGDTFLVPRAPFEKVRDTPGYFAK